MNKRKYYYLYYYNGMLYNLEIYVYILYGMVYLTQARLVMCYAEAWHYTKCTPHSIHIHHIHKYLYTKKKYNNNNKYKNSTYTRYKATYRLNVTHFYNDITNYNVLTMKTKCGCVLYVWLHCWAPTSVDTAVIHDIVFQHHFNHHQHDSVTATS